MTSKFEQLIELVINEDEAKAKELFHDIVVEKSREIYESLMQEEEAEELDEAEEEELDEAESCDEEELDESAEEEVEESVDETNLMADVESEEEGMQEGEEEEVEFGAEEGEAEEGGEDLEDRVVDLEDKLDELMAEFESLMGAEEAEHGDEVADIDGGDALEMDDTATDEFADEAMMENITLAAAPKPVTSEPEGTNKKSTTAFNSGAAGMEGAPVKATGTEAKGRPAPSTTPASSDKFQNEPATGSKKLSPAPKPVTAQASGVNTKTPFPKG